MNYIFVRVLLGFLAGWFIGFMMTRTAIKSKYESQKPIKQESQGTLKVVYDSDAPDQPVMGLEIESLSYILSNDKIILDIYKSGFPESKGPIYLRSSNDKSA